MGSWTREAIRRYQSFTQGYIAGYKEKIDCADLALASLIDFAYDNGLPVTLRYYSKGPKSFKSSDYTRDDYKRIVLDNLGALNVIDNTEPIELSAAGGGDLIMTKWDARLGHTRVIFFCAPFVIPNGQLDYMVSWFQGNLPAVVPELRTSLFSKIGNVYEGKPRRWRFSQF